MRAQIVKPNLFIVGAPKCGTTAWVAYLSSHPAVHFSPVKEPHYFCFDSSWRDIETEDEYLRLFEGAGSAKVVGEASVRYLYSAVAPKAIQAFNADAKIIIFVRDQEDFLPSWHNQMLYRAQDSVEDFEEAWRLSGTRKHGARDPRFLNYKDLGNFSQYVERWFDHFEPEQIRVFHFRDWSKNPRETYLEIMRFLDIGDDGRTEFQAVNEAKHRRGKWLAALLINPPPVVRRIGRLLNAQKLAGMLLKLTTRKGYRTQVDRKPKDELRAFYAADNAALEPRIWKTR